MTLISAPAFAQGPFFWEGALGVDGEKTLVRAQAGLGYEVTEHVEIGGSVFYQRDRQDNHDETLFMVGLRTAI